MNTQSTQFFRFLALCLVLLGTLPGFASSQVVVPTSPTPLPVGCPPVSLWQEGKAITNFGGGIARSARVRPAQASVDVQWRFYDPVPATLSVPFTLRSTASETFATSYWPTYVQQLDNNHWCVVGSGRGDEVVLEYWTFGSTHGGSPAPSIISYLEAGSTEPQYSWTLPPRIRVTEILRDASSTTGLVRALFRDPASPLSVLVWYDGSRALARRDLLTGQMTALAAPTIGAAPLVAPELTVNFDSFYSADLQGKGYCYFFMLRNIQSVSATTGLLVLVDSNRDGVLDSSAALTEALWESGGWGDPSIIIATY